MNREHIKQIFDRIITKFKKKEFPLGKKPSGVSKSYLLELAYRNIKVKKTRTIVTVGGVALAIGVIVLLVSFGFGLQELVLDRAIKLEEMKQAEVSTQPGSKLRLNQEALEQFDELTYVESALPLISVVGRVNYRNSAADIAVFGVTADYLKNSAIIFSEGEVFASNELTQIVPSSERIEVSDSRELVVNQSLLDLIGANSSEIVGEELSIEFTVPTELLNDEQPAIKTAELNFIVVGVVNESSAPLVYVPFIELRSLGIENYSQVKISVGEQIRLAEVRRNIEALGFVTTSVADTVEQINSIFSTFRIFLFAFGLVALAVASLGMFNTLTVSLLERTREIGLMKALGINSQEIRILFLLESTLMGFSGGLIGLLIGIFGGKLVDVLLSVLAVSKNVGAISISRVPILLSIAILALAVVIGILTGVYPAARATKISALDALRYE